METSNLLRNTFVSVVLLIGFLFVNQLNAQVANLYASSKFKIIEGETTSLAVEITESVGPYTVVYSDGTNNFTVEKYENDRVGGNDILITPTTTTTYSLVSVRDSYGNELLPISFNTATIFVEMDNDKQLEIPESTGTNLTINNY